MSPNMPDEQTRLALSKMWAAGILAERAGRNTPDHQACQLPLPLPMPASYSDFAHDPQVMLRK